MQLVTKIVAAFLVIVGLAVFLNLIATPLYHDGSLDYPLWKILNWFMAAAVLIILVVGFLRKRVLDKAGEEDASTLDHVSGSFVFYGGVVLAMLFYWGWFWTLNPDSETGEAVTSHLVYFPLVDSLFTVLAFIVGKRMWNAGDGGSQS